MKAKFVVSALATAVLIATLQPGAAAAYHYYVERTAAAGAPTHVWTFYNCINCIGRKRWPFSGSAFVEHGTVEFKELGEKSVRTGEPADARGLVHFGARILRPRQTHVSQRTRTPRDHRRDRALAARGGARRLPPPASLSELERGAPRPAAQVLATIIR